MVEGCLRDIFVCGRPLAEQLRELARQDGDAITAMYFLLDVVKSDGLRPGTLIGACDLEHAIHLMRPSSPGWLMLLTVATESEDKIFLGHISERQPSLDRDLKYNLLVAIGKACSLNCTKHHLL